MIRLVKSVSFFSLLLCGITSAYALGNDCNSRRASVETKIEQAKAHNNYHALAGLEKALSDINTYCNDDALIEDAKEKVTDLERKLDRKKRDLHEMQAEWNEEKSRKNSDKHLKYERKRLDKQEEINRIQQELNIARDEVTALKIKNK